MLENLLAALLGLIVILVALVLIAPAKCGELVYALIVKIESSLCGLKRSQLDIGEMKISMYQNALSADRPSIIMLHGFSSDKAVWIRFAGYFTKDFNLVIPDMAGHGDTGFDPSWDYSLPAQANRLAVIVEQLKTGKVHLIGNSMGGGICAHFAILHSDRCLSVTLIDSLGVESPIASDMQNMLDLGRNPFEIHNRQQFDEFYAMTMAKPPYVPGFVLEAISDKYQRRRQQIKCIFAQFREQDLLDTSLDEIRVPTLVLWGEDDRLLNISSVDVWKAGISNIQTKTWPGVGHMPMLEIPKESAIEYRDFLEKIPVNSS
jgi:abhydrolase domain-containing protein 6